MAALPPLSGPTTAFGTWAIVAPPSRWRPATCEEIDCGYWASGWTTTVPAGGELEHTIRQAGRPWAARTTNQDGTVSYTFAAGTACFRAGEHRVHRDDIEDVYVRFDGHHTAYTGGRTVHSGPVPWRDELGENQERLQEIIERG